MYIAMLRGINVGPHKRIKMDRLRESFASLGFEQVQTYIQSGNVVFKGGKSSIDALCKKIENKLLADFGFPVTVILRTQGELATTIAKNPFLNERGIDLTKLHVTFLSESPQGSVMKKLEALIPLSDRSYCIGKEIYWYLPNGVSQSVLMKAPVDRILAVSTTTRNWKTTNAILQMCLDCG
jgi:uncharacterized protein (DUF1697 family)